MLAVALPPLAEPRRHLTIAAFCLGAGVAATLTHGAATGRPLADLALRFAFGAVVALGATAAPPSALLLAAGLAAVTRDAAPMVAAGATVAVVLAGRPATVLRGALGGTLAVALQHVHVASPGRGLALGAVVSFIVLASGFRHLGERARRPLVWAGSVAVLAVLAGAGLAAAVTLLAGSDLREGIASAKRGLAAASAGRRDDAVTNLNQAAARLGDARSWLESSWAAPARLVPGAGQQLRALDAVATTGADLGRAGAKAATDADTSAIRLSQGSVPLDRIDALVGPLEAARQSLRRAATKLDRNSSPWLLAPLDRRFTDFQRRVDKASGEVDTGLAAARVAPGLLGAHGLRRYFLAVQTPTELRGSGGFIGNWGEIEADQGHLKLVHIGRTADLNDATPPDSRTLTGSPDFLARYARYRPQKLWQNVTVSPDFPSDAQLIASLYPQSGGRPIDGVIDIDPDGLAAMLRVIGPIQVEGWPDPLTPDNAGHVLLFDQYVRLQGQQRVDFLGQVAGEVWHQLTTKDLPAAPALAAALSPAVRAKRIQLWSARPDEERFFQSVGAGGGLPAKGGDDFFAVVNHNANPNKIDWFLHKEIDYRVATDVDGERRATATVTLRNDAPPDGLPDYVIGNALTNPPGSNLTYLYLYTPMLLRDATVDGQTATFESEHELGYHVYTGPVYLAPGASTVVELTLAGPAPAGCYRVRLHRQPTVSPDALSVTIDGHHQRRILDGDVTIAAPSCRRGR